MVVLLNVHRLLDNMLQATAQIDTGTRVLMKKCQKKTL